MMKNMGMSLYDLGVKKRKENGTENNKAYQFPVDTRVKVVSPFVDFNFFYDETGTVIKSSNNYLGIKVKIDKPHYFEDGTIQKDFNFNPRDLLILQDKEEKNEHE